MSKKKMKLKTPKTPRAEGGKNYYLPGDVPSPWIPFVVEYKPKSWLFGYGWKQHHFTKALDAMSAVRYTKQIYPNCRILGVYSLRWDKYFPNCL